MGNNFFEEKENFFVNLDKSVIQLLLKDKTTQKNIMWATDHYERFGEGYQIENELNFSAINGAAKLRVRPRVTKQKVVLEKRVKNKAEVFTPSWVCNCQNNSIDNDWFGYSPVFNVETKEGWITTQENIIFPKNKTWKQYVDLKRLEISCGEAPYICSLYDSVSGEYIPIDDRIGLLDRKLRIINENAIDDNEWNFWVKRAYQSVYGYEFQGDSLLLARENVFYTYVEHYRKRYNENPSVKEMKIIANIIAWNFWQMDGLKGVVPFSCNSKKQQIIQYDLFTQLENEENESCECPGCKYNDIKKHIGIYCKIQDWREKTFAMYVDTMGGEK